MYDTPLPAINEIHPVFDKWKFIKYEEEYDKEMSYYFLLHLYESKEPEDQRFHMKIAFDLRTFLDYRYDPSDLFKDFIEIKLRDINGALANTGEIENICAFFSLIIKHHRVKYGKSTAV